MPKLVRKITGKEITERLRISLRNNHTLDEKDAMWLLCSQELRLLGFQCAGPTDIYVPLITPDGRPLTHFPNGTLIKEHLIYLDQPYHCAADEYDIKYAPKPPKPR